MRPGGGRNRAGMDTGKTENYRVTFAARPAGNETHSPIRHVWVYITGVTGSSSSKRAASDDGAYCRTDVWRWSTALSANCRRGSYRFIPTERDDVFAACAGRKRPETRCVKAGDSYYRRHCRPAYSAKLAGVTWSCGFQRWKMPDAPLQPRDGIVVLKRRTRRLDDAVA
ncbi:DUF3327 domain-containing protein [Salmonella enterica subsp. enterica]|nr:DUF3327 domain-containing protein [Salmonella enterica subsp. enterica]